MLTQKERSHNSYIRRKEGGLCPRCGKPLDREGHYCSECLKREKDYVKETREWCRENNICTSCFKNRVYGDDKTCFECRAKKNNRRKPLTDEQREQQKKYFRGRGKMQYEERKAKGICVRCGKRKAAPGKVRCSICLSKDASNHRDKYLARSERGNYGLCYICGDEVYENFRVCKKCYDRIKKASTGNGGNNSYWKRQNKLIGMGGK